MIEYRGIVRADRRTKDLVKRMHSGEIAFIDHPDLDHVAAESLIRQKIKMVINASTSITGKYPNPGPQMLLEAGIPVLDAVGQTCFTSVTEGNAILIKDNQIFLGDRLIGEGILLTPQIVETQMLDAQKNIGQELEKFVQNTLEYALKEKDMILGGLAFPEIKTSLLHRQVLVVVRGLNYRDDLLAIRSYIREMNPFIIGVDGGADALLEFGYKPDIIIGDMDSVSDAALQCGAELIVHAYSDGRAPGLERIHSMNLDAKVFPAPGTSEDITFLLAYEKGADLIVAVGSHSNMIDFLEKGRKGMASTFLVRLKVGSILVDARGVNRLYRGRIKMKYLALILLAALIPLIIVFFINDFSKEWLRLIWIRLRIIFG